MQYLKRCFMGIILAFLPHIVLLYHLFTDHADLHQIAAPVRGVCLSAVTLGAVIFWLKLNIAPISKKQIKTFRLRALMGGRRLTLWGLYTAAVQAVLYGFALKMIPLAGISNTTVIIDAVITGLAVFILIAGGMIRILCASTHLRLTRRLIVISTIFIPVANVFSMLYACHMAALEYDYICNKTAVEHMRADSAVCQTKYPLVLLHGVSFRDLKYINYWGRIPKTLVRNGATIYYGHQEAWGTAKNNAQEIKDHVLGIIDKTGCKKINIIAHSKGGLDARYMISMLGMGDHVASLTTISTPHHGAKAVDVLCRLPDSVFRAADRFVNRCFRLIGDKNPEFYTVSRQFSTAYSIQFNETVKDDDMVYYQSYMSVMKNPFSHLLLAIPYIVIKCLEGDNDGLVTIDSAKWGNFRGVWRNKHCRGISHADIVDLVREDYKGFDVTEQYVQMVSELKAMGF